jgi:hypothetical protein
MIALILFVLGILASPFEAKSRLEAENAALRQQLIVLRRKVKSRPRLANTDRWFFVQLYRWFPSILDVLTIIRPETSDTKNMAKEREGLKSGLEPLAQEGDPRLPRRFSLKKLDRRDNV